MRFASSSAFHGVGLGAALALAGLIGACSSDEEAGPNGASPGGGGPVVLPDGAILSADGSVYPPLPPYVVDNTPLGPNYSIFEHGKECFDRFQVEVPSFDCDGPQSSRLKVEVNGVEVTDDVPDQCDKPSLVGTKYACVPGGRVTKFEQVNKYGHTIATVVACRRSSLSSLDSGEFDNIAVLQADLMNNETCWYQIRESGGFVGRNIPAPYTPRRTKGDAADQRALQVYESPVKLTSDNTECYRCHDNNQVWLRTPWIDVKNQVPGASGNTNEIPRPGGGPPTFIGKAYRGWNQAGSRPKQINIDATAFDQAFPPSASQRAAIAAGTLAPSDACTSCHNIGHSDISSPGQGTCNHFARYFLADKPSSFYGTVAGSKVSDYGNSFPHNAWMPPTAAAKFSNESEYRAFYERAFAAVERCCDNPAQPGCTK